MKQKKSSPLRRDSSMNGILKILIIGFVIVILFFALSGKEKAPKITPDVTEKTSVCSEESFPVCGKDGKTYTNSCTAEKIADVRVAYAGVCRKEDTGSIQTIAPTESGSEVDSGITDIGPVPKYETDRMDTGTLAVPSIDTPSEPVPTLSGATGFASGQIDPTLSVYSNSTYHYSFSMPKNSYYQAFGAQNGANHSVGIMTGTGVESLAGSEARVYFYANKVIEKLSKAENGFYTDPTTGTVYLLLNNKDSVMIESNNPDSSLVQTIVRTIHAE
ncbi:MAG: Kazal-type serine protease inhibitor family protein [Candidatus Gracilibacteria bacterium]|nr:Kazal-type serine protease inhibitor family protein [Candidatus Gracilibacteria bacterium]